MSDPDQGAVRYVYTLSSVGSLPESLILSLHTLLDYTDPSTVTVFYTPPRKDEHIDAIEAFGVDLRLVDNRTDGFSAVGESQHYGSKTYIGDIDAETVVFIDCDTFIVNDPSDLVVGEFDVAARPDGAGEMRQPQWRQLFERFGRGDAYIDWMPNCGVLVFKNGTHQEIAEQWRTLINTDLGYRHHEQNHKEQYALALCIGDREVRTLGPAEHAKLWEGEYPPAGIVYHAGGTFTERDIAPQTVLGAARLGMHHIKNRNF